MDAAGLLAVGAAAQQAWVAASSRSAGAFGGGDRSNGRAVAAAAARAAHTDWHAAAGFVRQAQQRGRSMDAPSGLPAQLPYVPPQPSARAAIWALEDADDDDDDENGGSDGGVLRAHSPSSSSFLEAWQRLMDVTLTRRPVADEEPCASSCAAPCEQERAVLEGVLTLPARPALHPAANGGPPAGTPPGLPRWTSSWYADAAHRMLQDAAAAGCCRTPASTPQLLGAASTDRCNRCRQPPPPLQLPALSERLSTDAWAAGPRACSGSGGGSPLVQPSTASPGRKNASFSSLALADTSPTRQRSPDKHSPAQRSPAATDRASLARRSRGGGGMVGAPWPAGPLLERPVSCPLPLPPGQAAAVLCAVAACAGGSDCTRPGSPELLPQLRRAQPDDGSQAAATRQPRRRPGTAPGAVRGVVPDAAGTCCCGSRSLLPQAAAAYVADSRGWWSMAHDSLQLLRMNPEQRRLWAVEWRSKSRDMAAGWDDVVQAQRRVEDRMLRQCEAWQQREQQQQGAGREDGGRGVGAWLRRLVACG